MLKICVRALVVAMTAALVVVGAAGAQDQPLVEEVEVYVQDLDRRGKPLGPRVKLTDAEARAKHEAGPDARSSAGDATIGPTSRATASVSRVLDSGCRAVDVARVGRSLLGFVTYKFWQRKNWCWSYPRVTGANSNAWVTNVDPNWYYHGVISSWGEFYNWCCNVWNSGHRSFRQAAFENCIFRYGCIKSEYPWVLIRGHSNGGFTYDTGT